MKIQKSVFSLFTKRFIHTLPKTSEIQIDNSINTNDIKELKKHPGKNVIKYIEIPSYLEDRINKVLSNINIPNLKEEADIFKRYLHDRRVPVEKNEIYEIKRKIKNETSQDEDLFDSEEDYLNEKFETKIEKVLKSKIHPWLKIDYNERYGHFYMVSRFVPDYAILYQIFSEIKKKDEKFCPNYIFDFGSGVGTVMWASNSVWENKSAEFMNIDTSSYMNSIANLITRNGSLSNQSYFRNAIFRRNFQKTGKEEFDLVTCAFSLFELPNRINRFETLSHLWQKVKENGYLVLVEIGTKHGFKIINESREFILRDLIKNDENTSNGYIFSPCPHQFECPLIKEKQVCRFFSSYRPLKVYDQNGHTKAKEEFPFSYIVIKKSSKSIDKNNEWPRLVYKHPLEITGGVIHSWLCTSEGKCEHLISAKNRCKNVRSLAKYSKLGDNLPIFINKIDQ